MIERSTSEELNVIDLSEACRFKGGTGTNRGS